jgi:Glycosyl transferase family 11
MKQRPMIVFLTGGLGNQLFQLANALTLDHDREVLLEWKLGKPRCNEQGLPDIMSFKLPDRAKLFERTRYSCFASKTVGYILRSGIAPKKWEKKSMIMRTLFFLGNLVLTIHFRQPIKVVRGSGIGYSPATKSPSHNFLIGYFQSYRFMSDFQSYKDLQLLSLTYENPEIDKFREIAKKENPIVVHFRLGDYKSEIAFGIPTKSYYNAAIFELTAKYPNSTIWVFSDDEKEARSMFPSGYMQKVRWFTDNKLSSAETLEIMRLGKSYVVANSTFSWWGAVLSKTENPSVICPDAWFRFQSEPLDLIPPSWMRVSAWEKT